MLTPNSKRSLQRYCLRKTLRNVKKQKSGKKSTALRGKRELHEFI
jgi:hypothetical protein